MKFIVSLPGYWSFLVKFEFENHFDGPHKKFSVHHSLNLLNNLGGEGLMKDLLTIMLSGLGQMYGEKHSMLFIVYGFYFYFLQHRRKAFSI